MMDQDQVGYLGGKYYWRFSNWFSIPDIVATNLRRNGHDIELSSGNTMGISELIPILFRAVLRQKYDQYLVLHSNGQEAFLPCADLISIWWDGRMCDESLRSWTPPIRSRISGVNCDLPRRATSNGASLIVLRSVSIGGWHHYHKLQKTNGGYWLALT